MKKLGRIPDGGGHRTLGLAKGKKNQSGVVYSEILENEKKETAAGFWVRANAFDAVLGITVSRVMTDNGCCYRSNLPWSDAVVGSGHSAIEAPHPSYTPRSRSTAVTTSRTNKRRTRFFG